MRSFQILDQNGNPIPINTLDAEVCELTGNEINPKWYCPLGRREDFKSRMEFITFAPNWFDSIGWRIAAHQLSLQGVLDDLAEGMKKYIGQTDEDGVKITLEYIYPYHCKVINTWIQKGYTAVSLD